MANETTQIMAKRTTTIIKQRLIGYTTSHSTEQKNRLTIPRANTSQDMIASCDNNKTLAYKNRHDRDQKHYNTFRKNRNIHYLVKVFCHLSDYYFVYVIDFLPITLTSFLCSSFTIHQTLPVDTDNYLCNYYCVFDFRKFY